MTLTIDITKLARKVTEINVTLEKGFDSIIMSAKNEIKLAISESATLADFEFLKSTKVDQTAFEELKAKLQEMENKVSEFKEQNDISFSDDEEEDSEENLDDVVDINNRDDDMIYDGQFADPDTVVDGNKSISNHDISPSGTDNRFVVLSNIEESKHNASERILLRKDTNKSVVDLKSQTNRSGESPTAFKRSIHENRVDNPHAQSRFSTQSHRTGISKIASSSKNLNQYGFGSSFYQKHQSQLKGSKKNPKVLLRYIQVQINDMCGKMMDMLNNLDLNRTEFTMTKTQLAECLSEFEKVNSEFHEIKTNYEHIDNDYQHIIKYYDFSKKQHEEILQYLFNTEKSLKDNEKEINKFIESQKRDVADKRKRIVNLEANLRQTDLNLRHMKEQKQKIIYEIHQEVQNLKTKENKRDEKVDDAIREIVNLDFKHGSQTEMMTKELEKIKDPIKLQMNNMQKENEVLLRELGRTQKDYRTMLNEFLHVVNTQEDTHPNIKSQILNTTSEIATSHDFGLMSNKMLTSKNKRPLTTVHTRHNKKSMVFTSAPFSVKSSPKKDKSEEYFSQPKNSPLVKKKSDDQHEILSKATHKTRATTQHRERIKSYHHKLEVREQNLSQGGY